MSPGPKPCGAAREPRRAAAGTSAPGSWHGARGVAAPLAAALLLPSAVLLLAGCGDAGTTAVDTMYPNTEQGPDYCMSCAEARGSEKDAQFLIQATFGPTRSSLQELGQTTPQAWVKEQLALPAGSHREYYRKRVSSRLTESPLVGSPRSRCSAGSRWHSFAFSIADKGKRINVTGNKIHVDGALRSDVDPAYTGNGIPAPNNCTDEPSNWMSNNGRTCSSVNSRFNCGSADADSAWIRDKICQQSCFDVGNGYSGDDCSPGWANQEDSGFICTVEENLGGVVTLGTTESCEAYRAYKNPAIWFSSSAVESIESLSFQEVRPGVVVLAESYGQDPCDLGRFVYHDGQYYLSDPRLELLQNDLASPSGGGLNTRCRAVTRTFLNEGSCQLRTACGAVEVEGSRPPASFALNATTFQFFLGSAERYVYAVTGLTDAETPCGRRSRWRLLDCGSEDCTATALSATEADATAAALALEEGHLRDVYVHCESAGAVPAGAVVVSGSGYFLHVHSNEYNVYDFTDWVNAHPGGTEQIMRWASGDFQLEFPPSHAMSRWVSAQSSLHYIGRLGDTVDFEVLPVGLQAAWTVGYESCGSPGEVANDPSLGHHFSLYTDFNAGYTDTNYEVPFWGVQSKLSRTTVWTMLALDADDQLRQRAAWALSQILVTSINGVSSSSNHAEGWLVYYDIFVRNAFGNYRDILREVTYSPIMGEYLSYRNSRSLDSDSSYPDENYAREIMQLFTIGLWELNLDGTRKTDASGNHVPTYTNEHIMSLARVFTGFREQAARPNIENTGTRNMVDPMQMVGDWHDVYPKPDLSGGYLGDGYPLCSDLPPQAFLLEGARYEFRGYTYAGTDVLVLSSSSALYAALEQIQLTVELSSTIDCTGEKECVADSLHVVQVGEGYYEYVPPTCVHLYFYNGQVVSPGSANDFGKEWKEICMDPNWMGAGTACCKGCSNVGTSGMANQNRTCENMAETWPWVVKTGCPQVSDWWVENKFCQLACWELGMGYAGDDCSDGPLQSERVCGYYQEKVRFEAASARCESLGMHVCEQGTDGGECGHDDINVWTPRNCTVSLEVREDGRVASQWDSKTMQNPFPVTWADGFPTTGNCPSQCAQSSSGCTCPISVVAKAVFDAVPSRAELLGEGARLRIGAFPPSVSAFCLAPCDGEVKAYASDDIGHVDESTVFECGGVYYKNMESAVDVAGYTFRNPPVFMLAKELTGRSVRADEALAEVEALLDHLVNHPNVPPFVSHRLIQRFVTSNPTPDYVSAVAQAFSTGEFNGETYSGEYGDLGATFAAILLHPQARGGFLDSSVGKLREPIIKILHFLRSMEYVDLRDREIVMRSLDDDIGQWPYASPSVFNYYGVEYGPAGLHTSLVAPEFEIFTPPFALAWFNGMMSLVDNGLSQCDYGFGQTIRTCVRPEGELLFSVSESSTLPNASFTEVSLLLTGGRIGNEQAFEAALEVSGDGDPLKAAMRAVLMSPEFHALGDPDLIGTRSTTTEEPPQQPDSYKAMVMLYLHGGADTFNMLVPTCDTLYQEYLDVRQDVALPQGKLLGISASTQTCSSFGVHHGLPFVRDLYEQGQLAFVSNIGALVQPTTKAQIQAKTAVECAGLYSHIDQQNGGMTLQCQVQGVSPKGFGGRLADALAAEDYFTTSFSLAGTSTWSQGQTIGVEIVDGRNGAVRLEGYQWLQDIVGNVTNIAYNNVYCEEYARQFASAVKSSERLGAILDSSELATSYDTSTGLAMQLHQVARLIATRTQRGAERDFFYVELGGFDTHDWVNEVLEEKFAELNAALEGFVAELKGQDIFDSTVLVTSSDFGRTLTSNGKGTDHAWAGNHFVLGGSVNGGHIFNRFPESLLENNAQDAGRGRLIPLYPWESMMVPIAEWLGGQPSSWSAVFPNLVRFNTSEHIISMSSLFSSYDLV